MFSGALRFSPLRCRRHGAADLGQVHIHRRGVGIGQDKRRTGIACRANGAENIGPFIPAVARCRSPAAAVGPKSG